MTTSFDLLNEIRRLLKGNIERNQATITSVFAVSLESLLAGIESTLDVVQVTSDYIASARNSCILADATAGNITVTLPRAEDFINYAAGTTKLMYLKKSDAGGNAVFIVPNVVDTIEGAASYDLVSPLQSVVLVSDGNDWLILSTNATGGGGGGGSGDVVGPASSVDNTLARFNGSSGTLIQGSVVTVDDSGNLTTAGTIDGRDVSVDGATLDAHVGAGGAAHAAATTLANGFLSAADKTKLDGIATGATATPLTLSAPADVGTTAVGVSTAAARSDHVHAHGNQLGGTLHADVIAGGASGFMSGSDKTKLDGVATGATATPLTALSPADVGTTAVGASLEAARADHVHAHGVQLGGTLHAVAVASGAAGFLSGADKAKLDGIEALADVTDAANVNAAGAVMESDYTPAYSILVQQSGTGTPTVLTLGNNTLLGRLSGGGAAIDDLSASQVKTMLAISASEVSFTPDGDIAATTTQAAVVEVRNDTDTKLSSKASIAGQLGGTGASPTVIAITETSGPTALTIGAIADGEYLVRSGTTLVGSAGGGGGVTDHGLLTGLADDDHTQYLLVAGTRAMTGALDMGTFAVTNVGAVDGRDVSADGAALDAHIAAANPHSGSLSTAHEGAGGAVHANVVAAGAAGFMTGADKTKLDGIATGATATPLTAAAPASVGVTAVGVSTEASRADHVHAHGNQAGGSLHADVIAAGASGFMTGADKTKLDGIEALADVTDATNVAAAGAVMDSDFAGSSIGDLIRTGVGTYSVLQHNLGSAVAPTVTDDNTAGYVVGSRWIDTVADQVYFCADASTGAAVWRQVGAGGGGGITSVNGDTGPVVVLTASEIGFTPNGDIAASDIQAAVVEVRDDTDTKLSTKASIAGQLGGTGASPTVLGARETAGPTLLTYGAIADGDYLRRVGTTIVGGTPAGGGGGNTIKTVRGFASGAAAGDRAAYERSGGDPFTGSFTMATIFQTVVLDGGEQRLCGTTTEFATNGVCIAYDDPGYIVCRGLDNLGAGFGLDVFDGKLGLDLVFACVTFDSTTGNLTLGLNGAARSTLVIATGAITAGGNFTIGAGAGAPGTTGATDQEIHGAAILLGTAITTQQERDWWRLIAAGAGIGSGPAGEAWEATDTVPTSSTWVASVGATDLVRVGSAADPTLHDAGRVWFRG